MGNLRYMESKLDLPAQGIVDPVHDQILFIGQVICHLHVRLLFPCLLHHLLLLRMADLTGN